jgi:hypothetical protein
MADPMGDCLLTATFNFLDIDPRYATGQVKKEEGRSPDRIFNHYSQLVVDFTARAFSINADFWARLYGPGTLF